MRHTRPIRGAIGKKAAHRIVIAAAFLFLIASPLARSKTVASNAPPEFPAAGSTGASNSLTRTCAARTKTFLDALVAGHYKDAWENFDGATGARLNATEFGAFWAGLGTLHSRGTPQTATKKGSAGITVQLDFDVGKFLVRLSCNGNGRFVGFQLAPVLQPSPPARTSQGFQESEVRIGKPSLPLGATLDLPTGKGPFPGVVLVSGAGTHDRDEAFGPDKPLRDIARALAARGIATLRYDKPAFDHPLAFIGTPYTIDDEYTNPAIDAVDRLRATPQIDPRRVFVLGHSQGGEMAPRIGQREPSIAGLILVAAPAQSLAAYFKVVEQSSSELIKRYPQYAKQIRQNAAVTEATKNWLAKADPKHPGALGPDGTPASYWLSLRDYKSEVIAVAKGLHQPMLILQGDRDDSVSPRDDFGLWRQAFAHDPRVTLKEYPTLSHLMTPVSDPPSPSDDEKPAHVDPQVIEDIARWIESRKR